MRELSIFVDESGDFGAYEKHSPFYIFSLVIHDQAAEIAPNILKLENKLSDLGLERTHCLHVGPIIRREEDYQYDEISQRRKYLNALMAFCREAEIKYTSFLAEKRQNSDALALTITLSKHLSGFIQENLLFFQSFDRVIVYYDNGQTELNRILASVFSTTLSKVEFRRVIPSEYRLFQVADLCCSLELIKAKIARNELSAGERIFFGNARDLHKNYLKPLEKLRW
ncbi:MAG: DUF3800 domain-containing protein [Oscillospiraceae bacterium]|nr:DUF3800 domain-containing protein [Oscillospiraceae bacterium]